jgi:hypothetical protein
VTRRESEWDEEQAGWVLALAMCRELTCDGCGGWLPETTTHDDGWHVDAPWRCHACTAVSQRQQSHAASIRTNTSDGHMHATRWHVERRTDGEPHGVGRTAGEGRAVRIGDSLG